MEEGTRAASEDVDRVSEQASERFVSYRRGRVVRREPDGATTRREEKRREEKRREEKRREACVSEPISIWMRRDEWMRNRGESKTRTNKRECECEGEQKKKTEKRERKKESDENDEKEEEKEFPIRESNPGRVGESHVS